MELELAQKTVLITGASGSLGHAIADAFAREGACLVLQGNSRFDDLKRWTREQSWRDRARLVEVDLTRPGLLEPALDAVLGKDERIDVAVANAGHWPREKRMLHEIDEERWRSTLDANLMSAVRTAAATMRRLERLGPRPDESGAAIVLVGSTAGRFGEREHSDYAAAKAALLGLARTLKNEITRLDRYARVNVVEPGWTIGHVPRPEIEKAGVLRRVTRTMALRQIGRAEDVARAILFLSSSAASRHVSGEKLAVAGGMEGRTLWDDEEIDEAAIRRRLRPD